MQRNCLKIKFNHIMSIMLLLLLFNINCGKVFANNQTEPENWKNRWYVNTIWYQIFPDRFFNSDTGNDPDFIETYEKNGKLIKQKVKDWNDDSPTWTDKYGGDLYGIIQKLPYLNELGITGIWLNPIFKATSNHKYNTSDYAVVDPSFGDREVLKALIKQVHEKQMYLILDGVFNHCGYEFWVFQDIVKNGKNSPYTDWFHIKSYPIIPLWEQTAENKANYECWWGFGSLPQLNLDNPDTRNYIFDICKSWMKLGIDGWRLDVPEEVKSKTFWTEWAKEMKAQNKNAYLTGEIWGEAKDWLLEGDKFDGIMNYHGFREPVLLYFSAGKIKVSQFDKILAERRALYPHYINCALQNLLSSHDTVRILSALKNQDEKDGDKEKKDYDISAPNEETIKKYKAVVLFQMTYVGAPMIYYGDEIGMYGGKDPNCRKPFVWDESKQNKDLLNWHKKLIEIRNKHKALRTGDFNTVFTKDKQNIYCYERVEKDEILTICINYSKDEQKVSIPTKENRPFMDLITASVYKPEKKHITLKIKPYTGVILEQIKEKGV